MAIAGYDDTVVSLPHNARLIQAHLSNTMSCYSMLERSTDRSKQVCLTSLCTEVGETTNYAWHLTASSAVRTEDMGDKQSKEGDRGTVDSPECHQQPENCQDVALAPASGIKVEQGVAECADVGPDIRPTTTDNVMNQDTTRVLETGEARMQDCGHPGTGTGTAAPSNGSHIQKADVGSAKEQCSLEMDSDAAEPGKDSVPKLEPILPELGLKVEASDGLQKQGPPGNVKDAHSAVDVDTEGQKDAYALGMQENSSGLSTVAGVSHLSIETGMPEPVLNATPSDTEPTFTTVEASALDAGTPATATETELTLTTAENGVSETGTAVIVAESGISESEQAFTMVETGALDAGTTVTATETEVTLTAAQAEPTSVTAETGTSEIGITMTAAETEPSLMTTETCVSETGPSLTTAETGASETEPSLTTAETGVSETEPRLTTAETGVSETEPSLTTADTGVSETEPSLTTADTGVSETEPSLTTADTGVSETDVTITHTETEGSELKLPLTPAASEITTAELQIRKDPTEADIPCLTTVQADRISESIVALNVASAGTAAACPAGREQKRVSREPASDEKSSLGAETVSKALASVCEELTADAQNKDRTGISQDADGQGLKEECDPLHVNQQLEPGRPSADCVPLVTVVGFKGNAGEIQGPEIENLSKGTEVEAATVDAWKEAEKEDHTVVSMEVTELPSIKASTVDQKQSDTELPPTDVHEADQKQSDTELSTMDVHDADQKQSDPELSTTDVHDADQKRSDTELSTTDVHDADQKQRDTELSATDVHDADQKQSDTELSATDVHDADQKQSDTELSTMNVHDADQKQSDTELPPTDVHEADQKQSDTELSTMDVHDADQKQSDTELSTTDVHDADQKQSDTELSTTDVHDADQKQSDTELSTTDVHDADQKRSDTELSTMDVHDADQKQSDTELSTTDVHDADQKQSDTELSTTDVHDADQKQSDTELPPTDVHDADQKQSDTELSAMDVHDADQKQSDTELSTMDVHDADQKQSDTELPPTDVHDADQKQSDTELSTMDVHDADQKQSDTELSTTDVHDADQKQSDTELPPTDVHDADQKQRDTELPPTDVHDADQKQGDTELPPTDVHDADEKQSDTDLSTTEGHDADQKQSDTELPPVDVHNADQKQGDTVDITEESVDLPVKANDSDLGGAEPICDNSEDMVTCDTLVSKHVFHGNVSDASSIPTTGDGATAETSTPGDVFVCAATAGDCPSPIQLAEPTPDGNNMEMDTSEQQSLQRGTDPSCSSIDPSVADTLEAAAREAESLSVTADGCAPPDAKDAPASECTCRDQNTYIETVQPNEVSVIPNRAGSELDGSYAAQITGISAGEADAASCGVISQQQPENAASTGIDFCSEFLEQNALGQGGGVNIVESLAPREPEGDDSGKMDIEDGHLAWVHARDDAVRPSGMIACESPLLPKQLDMDRDKPAEVEEAQVQMIVDNGHAGQLGDNTDSSDGTVGQVPVGISDTREIVADHGSLQNSQSGTIYVTQHAGSQQQTHEIADGNTQLTFTAASDSTSGFTGFGTPSLRASSQQALDSACGVTAGAIFPLPATDSTSVHSVKELSESGVNKKQVVALPVQAPTENRTDVLEQLDSLTAKDSEAQSEQSVEQHPQSIQALVDATLSSEPDPEGQKTDTSGERSKHPTTRNVSSSVQNVPSDLNTCSETEVMDVQPSAGDPDEGGAAVSKECTPDESLVGESTAGIRSEDFCTQPSDVSVPEETSSSAAQQPSHIADAQSGEHTEAATCSEATVSGGTNDAVGESMEVIEHYVMQRKKEGTTPPVDAKRMRPVTVTGGMEETTSSSTSSDSEGSICGEVEGGESEESTSSVEDDLLRKGRLIEQAGGLSEDYEAVPKGEKKVDDGKEAGKSVDVMCLNEENAKVAEAVSARDIIEEPEVEKAEQEGVVRIVTRSKKRRERMVSMGVQTPKKKNKGTSVYSRKSESTQHPVNIDESVGAEVQTWSSPDDDDDDDDDDNYSTDNEGSLEESQGHARSRAYGSTRSGRESGSGSSSSSFSGSPESDNGRNVESTGQKVNNGVVSDSADNLQHGSLQKTPEEAALLVRAPPGMSGSMAAEAGETGLQAAVAANELSVGVSNGAVLDVGALQGPVVKGTPVQECTAGGLAVMPQLATQPSVDPVPEGLAHLASSAALMQSHTGPDTTDHPPTGEPSKRAVQITADDEPCTAGEILRHTHTDLCLADVTLDPSASSVGKLSGFQPGTVVNLSLESQQSTGNITLAGISSMVGSQYEQPEPGQVQQSAGPATEKGMLQTTGVLDVGPAVSGFPVQAQGADDKTCVEKCLQNTPVEHRAETVGMEQGGSKQDVPGFMYDKAWGPAGGDQASQESALMQNGREAAATNLEARKDLGTQNPKMDGLKALVTLEPVHLAETAHVPMDEEMQWNLVEALGNVASSSTRSQEDSEQAIVYEITSNPPEAINVSFTSSEGHISRVAASDRSDEAAAITGVSDSFSSKPATWEESTPSLPPCGLCPVDEMTAGSTGCTPSGHLTDTTYTRVTGSPCVGPDPGEDLVAAQSQTCDQKLVEVRGEPGESGRSRILQMETNHSSVIADPMASPEAREIAMETVQNGVITELISQEQATNNTSAVEQPATDTSENNSSEAQVIDTGDAESAAAAAAAAESSDAVQLTGQPMGDDETEKLLIAVEAVMANSNQNSVQQHTMAEAEVEPQGPLVALDLSLKSTTQPGVLPPDRDSSIEPQSDTCLQPKQMDAASVLSPDSGIDDLTDTFASESEVADEFVATPLDVKEFPGDGLVCPGAETSNLEIASSTKEVVDLVGGTGDVLQAGVVALSATDGDARLQQPYSAWADIQKADSLAEDGMAGDNCTTDAATSTPMLAQPEPFPGQKMSMEEVIGAGETQYTETLHEVEHPHIPVPSKDIDTAAGSGSADAVSVPTGEPGSLTHPSETAVPAVEPSPFHDKATRQETSVPESSSVTNTEAEPVADSEHERKPSLNMPNPVPPTESIDPRDSVSGQITTTSCSETAVAAKAVETARDTADVDLPPPAKGAYNLDFLDEVDSQDLNPFVTRSKLSVSPTFPAAVGTKSLATGSLTDTTVAQALGETAVVKDVQESEAAAAAGDKCQEIEVGVKSRSKTKGKSRKSSVEAETQTSSRKDKKKVERVSQEVQCSERVEQGTYSASDERVHEAGYEPSADEDDEFTEEELREIAKIVQSAPSDSTSEIDRLKRKVEILQKSVEESEKDNRVEELRERKGFRPVEPLASELQSVGHQAGEAVDPDLVILAAVQEAELGVRAILNIPSPVNVSVLAPYLLV